jgi:hypothetical protein
MPDLEALTPGDAEAVWRAAKLARGEALIDDWTEPVRLPHLPPTDRDSVPGVYAVKEEEVVIGEFLLSYAVKYTWFDAVVTSDDTGAVITPVNHPGRRRSELG